MLTISGERKFEKEEKNKKYHRVERAYGSFMLPDDADAEKAKAEFKGWHADGACVEEREGQTQTNRSRRRLRTSLIKGPGFARNRRHRAALTALAKQQVFTPSSTVWAKRTDFAREGSFTFRQESD